MNFMTIDVMRLQYGMCESEFKYLVADRIIYNKNIYNKMYGAHI